MVEQIFPVQMHLAALSLARELMKTLLALHLHWQSQWQMNDQHYSKLPLSLQRDVQ